MAVRRKRTKDHAVYFGTFTCYQWTPLIHMTDAYDAVYKWMHIAHGLGYRFFGYAIMPNHLIRAAGSARRAPGRHTRDRCGGMVRLTFDEDPAGAKSAQGYEPFGSLLPGRNYSSTTDTYRFGFQGQESDGEINGERNSYAFEYRMHDPRIGRFLSIDPLAQDFAWNSPYAFSENRVLDGIDFEGLEHLNNKYLIDRSTGGKTQLTVMDEYKQPGPGKQGWGIDARFYMKDESGVIHEVPELRVFIPSDPPLFHFGGGPLYVNGWEVPNSAPRAMEGEHGFHNGGKQVMMGTVGLILSGGSMVAAGSVSFTGAAGLALTADELTAGGKNGSVMEQLIGKTPTKYIKLANLVGSFSTGLTSLIKNTANGKTDDFFIDFMNVLNDEFDLMMEVAPPLNGDGAKP